MSASFNSAANVPFSVKIGAKISTLSLSIVILVPLVVFFGSILFISDVTYSLSRKSNSNMFQNFFVIDSNDTGTIF